MKVRCNIVGVNAIPRHQFAKIATIDDAQRVKAINARRYTLGFDVRKPTGWDFEVTVLMPLGDSQTCRLYISNGESELVSKLPKLQSWITQKLPPTTSPDPAAYMDFSRLLNEISPAQVRSVDFRGTSFETGLPGSKLGQQVQIHSFQFTTFYKLLLLHNKTPAIFGHL